MKKYSFLFILLQIVIVFIISWLFAMGFGFISFNENIPVTSLKNWLPLTLPLVTIIYVACANKNNGRIAKKTMEKNSKAQNFGKTYTFINSDFGTAGSILRIDEGTGRVAYVSYLNPFKFQMAQADELTDVASSYMSGPVNTTRYVYFQFRYKNKRMRIPTFTSRRMHMITSSCVKEGIEKADHFRDAILKHQK